MDRQRWGPDDLLPYGRGTPASALELYRTYFRAADIDFSEGEDEEVTLGLGVFPGRTMPITYWDSVQ